MCIQYPKQVAKWQEKLCAQLGLKSRIILAHQGILKRNAGRISRRLRAYIAAMDKHPLFGNIDFKESPGSSDYFPRLRIVIKKEMAHLGLDTNAVKAKDGGMHVSPQQAHAMMQEKPKDLLILDCRNSYETKIGTFTDALAPNTNYFREFPQYVDINIWIYLKIKRS